MDKLDARMDQALAAKVTALHAGDDESGDGRIDLADLKLQLDRVEAQLELQDKQNRALLRGQRLRLALTLLLTAVLCAAVVFLGRRVNAAYDDILQTSRQVNELAARVQDSLDTLDTGELDALVQSLPEITDKLSKVDVDALNEVLTRMPALMDTIADVQGKIADLQRLMNSFTSGLGGLFKR